MVIYFALGVLMVLLMRSLTVVIMAAVAVSALPGYCTLLPPQPTFGLDPLFFQVWWGRWLGRRLLPLLCSMVPGFSWWRQWCWCWCCIPAFPDQGIWSRFHMSATKWILWFGFQWGGGTPRVLHILPSLSLPFCILATSWGVCVVTSALGWLCMFVGRYPMVLRRVSRI